MGQDRLLVVAESAFEAVDRGETVGQPRKLGRVVIDGLGQGADGRCDIVELGLQPAQTVRDLTEPRVQPGKRA